MNNAGHITGLLLAWSQGDRVALARLMPVVYDELRQLASTYLRRERSDHTLETCALVHEAFLRIFDQRKVCWRNRHHFFGIAAQQMRRILIDHARSHLAQRRGGKLPLLRLDQALTPSPQRPSELIALDEALDRLASLHPQQARIVELRFFVGLTSREIACILGVSVPTVSRRWRMARAWLYRSLRAGEGSEA